MNNNYHDPNENWYFKQKFDDNQNSYKAYLYCIIGDIILVILAFLLYGCGSIQYVPVETIKTEYKNRVDTLKQIDSVFSEKETIIREADSALILKLGLQLKSNEKAILVLKRELEKKISKESEHTIDTIIKVDSVQVPYPVERKLSKWEQTKMDIGGYSIFGFSIAFIVLIIGFVLKARRNI